MKETIKLGFALLAVTFIAGFVLNKVYTVTKPRIDAIKAMEEESAKTAVLSGAEKYVERLMDQDMDPEALIGRHAVNRYWVAENSDGIMGYVVKVYGYGYDPTPIIAMLGMDTLGRITGVKIIQQAETPGLGARCTETEKQGDVEVTWFTEQYKGLKGGAIEVVKRSPEEGEDAITAITGATVTSSAVTDSINSAADSLFKSITEGAAE